MTLDHSMFAYTRVRSAEEMPPAERGLLDVVILDMNFGFPNLGHDSLVHAVHESARAVELACDLTIRVVSIDIRRDGYVPELDPERFRLFIGTGGPGHLDPTRNDGISAWSEGVRDEADWEPQLFALYDAIVRDERVALFAFCHSYGVMCRWSGIAEPVLRPEEKGRSDGIVTYELSEEARGHPWFSRFERELSDAPRFRVLDSRMFDLMPVEQMAEMATPLAWEADPIVGDPALTMVEFARDRDGTMPRVFAANHHPEVIDLEHLQAVLDEKLATGEVDESWHRERGTALRRYWDEPNANARVRRTSRYTLMEPLRFHLEKIAAARGAMRAS